MRRQTPFDISPDGLAMKPAVVHPFWNEYVGIMERKWKRLEQDHSEEEHFLQAAFKNQRKTGAVLYDALCYASQ